MEDIKINYASSDEFLEQQSPDSAPHPYKHSELDHSEKQNMPKDGEDKFANAENQVITSSSQDSRSCDEKTLKVPVIVDNRLKLLEEGLPNTVLVTNTNQPDYVDPAVKQTEGTIVAAITQPKILSSQPSVFSTTHPSMLIEPQPAKFIAPQSTLLSSPQLPGFKVPQLPVFTAQPVLRFTAPHWDKLKALQLIAPQGAKLIRQQHPSTGARRFGAGLEPNSGNNNSTGIT